MGDEAIRHFLQTKQPLAGGPGRPEDLAGAAVFLCSDEARLLTGVVLPVDGGWGVSEGQFQGAGGSCGERRMTRQLPGATSARLAGRPGLWMRRAMSSLAEVMSRRRGAGAVLRGAGRMRGDRL